MEKGIPDRVEGIPPAAGTSTRGPQVSIGDVVIIHSDDQPRGMWSLGRVEELLVGNDGEARGAVLRVAGKGRRAKHL